MLQPRDQLLLQPRDLLLLQPRHLQVLQPRGPPKVLPVLQHRDQLKSPQEIHPVVHPLVQLLVLPGHQLVPQHRPQQQGQLRALPVLQLELLPLVQPSYQHKLQLCILLKAQQSPLLPPQLEFQRVHQLEVQRSVQVLPPQLLGVLFQQ